MPTKQTPTYDEPTLWEQWCQKIGRDPVEYRELLRAYQDQESMRLMFEGSRRDRLAALDLSSERRSAASLGTLATVAGRMLKGVKK